MDETRVAREPLTYHRHSPNSYLRDRIEAENGDNAARARLKRHADEMEVELAARDARAWELLDSEDLEVRANPSRTAGQGGYFSPPLWLIEHFATAVRHGRVLAALAPNLPLPGGVQSVGVPRLTTGAHAGPANDGGAVPSRDPVDAPVTSPVVSIAGQVDTALQALEQSPRGAHFDWAMFKDLHESYDAQVERQMITGTGSNGTFPGILAAATGAGGVNAVTYTDGTPTGPEGFPLVGQMAAQIGDNRLLPPEAWLMRTARWAWLASAEDTATMPIVPAGYSPAAVAPPRTPDDKPNAVSVLLGWPVFPDDAIPATLGATSTEDAVIACRPSDHLLLESDLRTTVNLEPLSGTLQARLQLRGYAAHLIRYPQGIATLTGAGMVVQTGY